MFLVLRFLFFLPAASFSLWLFKSTIKSPLLLRYFCSWNLHLGGTSTLWRDFVAVLKASPTKQEWQKIHCILRNLLSNPMGLQDPSPLVVLALPAKEIHIYSFITYIIYNLIFHFSNESNKKAVMYKSKRKPPHCVTDLQVKTNPLPLNKKYNRIKIDIHVFHAIRFSCLAHETTRLYWHCASSTEEEECCCAARSLH